MDDLYDEFGNFIGDASGASGDESEQGADAGNYAYNDDDYSLGGEAREAATLGLMEVNDTEGRMSSAVVLHEDKQYYPSAQQVYGNWVETLVQEEDAQPLTEPIIALVDEKRFTVQEDDLPPVSFDRGFMADLMRHPDHIRNVAFAGHLHHGKTAFMDMLVLETHEGLGEKLERRHGRSRDEQLRYTDVHVLERERGLSIKAAPMSLVLQSTRGKSYLFNMIDTPGHVNFADEVASAMRLADGLCLVVDVVEGVQANTEQIIRHAVLESVPLTLVINKLDRLILELKLPPNDAYFKLKHVVEEVNTVIASAAADRPEEAERQRLSPEKGNVLFACTAMGWCFTLQSFGKMYADGHREQRQAERLAVDADEFARRLWGDVFFNPRTRSFTRKPEEEGGRRAFVQFVMEPIYKLFAHAISASPEDLKSLLATLGITLKPSQYKADAKALVKLACAQFFGPSAGFVDMVVRHVPSPAQAAASRLERHYTGPLDTDAARAMAACDAHGPLVVHVTKLMTSSDAKAFYALGRVMSGTARPGIDVRVLGEGYSVDDDEDMAAARISDVWISETRYSIPIDGLPAGNWALLGGVDNSIVKSATIVDATVSDAHIIKPVSHFTQSVFKVAVEPVNPSELPKMLDGIRRINKSYPLVTTKVEESGEHIILGTGELYMDCVLHDLRRLYGQMEIKVSDPVTRFCETVLEESATKCYAITPNKKNRIALVAEPLGDEIAKDIESGAVRIREPARKIAKFFQERHDWDVLAARSIWAFGPDDMGPNLLQDDTLPTEVDKKLLNTVKESIRQGFSWATREGPLCEEPIRNTRFKIMDVTLAPEPIFRGGGQIIPTSRRACYSSFLMASPRLMEPMYAVSILGTQESVAQAYTTLARRRGHVLSDGPVPGTPLYRVNGLIPVIDSFGFETDLRINAKGKATVTLVFDRWNIVPGDPLDTEVVLRPLQPASAQATARDFVLKTRRRKGLSEDVSVAKFLEPEFYNELIASGVLGDQA